MTELSKSKNTLLRTDSEDILSSTLAKPDLGIWELIFDSLPDMVALIDKNNIIVKANKLMKEKLNVGDSGILGHKCFSLMHQNGCSPHNCPHIKMLKDLNPCTIELFEPNFGSYLNFTSTPIFDSDNNLLGSLHIVRDITIQKEAEARQKQYNDELKELNLGRDKFFSIVAHDLRSPFQGMLGFTDLILEELDILSKEEIKEYLQKVRDSSYGTFTLLENLLNWSKLQTGRLHFSPSAFSITDDISSVLNLLQSNALSKNMNIINHVTTNFQVFADQQMVHSILLNLITNAIKFTFPGGTITIDAKIILMCDDSSEGTNSCIHHCLEIRITDTGVGIPPIMLDKLLTEHGSGTLAGTSNEKGAGLGLILAKEMAEKHGGKLKVSSEIDKGTVFAFTLPLAPKKQMEA